VVWVALAFAICFVCFFVLPPRTPPDQRAMLERNRELSQQETRLRRVIAQLEQERTQLRKELGESRAVHAEYALWLKAHAEHDGLGPSARTVLADLAAQARANAERGGWDGAPPGM